MASESSADRRDAKGRFGPGNAGRPKGARNKTTQMLEAMLQGEAETLLRAMVDRAKAGDINALKYCLDRLVQTRADDPVHFDIPEIITLTDAHKAGSSVLKAVSAGQLTPREAERVMGLVETVRRVTEDVVFETRLSKLEEAVEGARRS